MPAIARLTGADLSFPDSAEALDEPNGLLAVGGDLSPNRLLAAYRRGIFPWYEAPQPILWWTPDPRSVLYPRTLHVSRSLRRTLKRQNFEITCDRAFGEVMQRCAGLRLDGLGTWIGEAMLQAYQALHRRGYAHSIEVWQDNRLVGGLYGVALGRAFFGESMFSAVSDASKTALVALVQQGGFELIDCQVESEHLNSLGARNVRRLDFEQQLVDTIDKCHEQTMWHQTMRCGDLI